MTLADKIGCMTSSYLVTEVCTGLAVPGPGWAKPRNSSSKMGRAKYEWAGLGRGERLGLCG